MDALNVYRDIQLHFSSVRWDLGPCAAQQENSPEGRSLTLGAKEHIPRNHRISKQYLKKTPASIFPHPAWGGSTETLMGGFDLCYKLQKSLLAPAVLLVLAGNQNYFHENSCTDGLTIEALHSTALWLLTVPMTTKEKGVRWIKINLSIPDRYRYCKIISPSNRDSPFPENSRKHFYYCLAHFLPFYKPYPVQQTYSGAPR